MVQMLLVLHQAVCCYMSQHVTGVTLKLMEVTPVDKTKVTDQNMWDGTRKN